MYVHSCPCTPHAAHTFFRPSLVTHLLFLFRQASQGRSRRPRTTLASFPGCVDLAFDGTLSIDLDMEVLGDGMETGTPAGSSTG